MMRYLAILAFTLVVWFTLLQACSLAFAAPEPSPALTLARTGATPYVIAIADSATAPEKNAAAELATYLKQITGAEFAVVSPVGATGKPSIAVGPDAAQALAPSLDLAKDGEKGLGEDGIVLKVASPHLILTGAKGAKRGTLYAVYEFLEREVGVRWWTEKASFVPSKPDLAVRDLDIRYRPVFDYREALYFYLEPANVDRAKLLVRHRFNGHFNRIPTEWGDSYEVIGWCHTFEGFLPPANYFKDHPDWYSEVKGKRTAEKSQLCCTNDAMIAELTKNMLGIIRKQPDAGMISLTQNDWNGHCECARCKALDDAEGSHAGSLLYCVNKVAEAVDKEFPGFRVVTLAYQHTRRPPKTIRPRQNVLIQFAVAERSAAQQIDSKANHELMDDLRAWKAAAPSLFIWDYTANMTGPYTPHPTLPVYVPDLRTYAANHASGVFFEGNHLCKILGDFDELKTYVMSHAMWNPRIDENRIVDEFLVGYYGKAGPVLRRYLGLLAESGRDTNLNSWDAGVKANWLDLDAMNRATALFDQAEQAVADDPVLLKRVRIARLPIDHQWLRGYQMYKAQAAMGGAFKGPANLAAALEEFLVRASWSADGAIILMNQGNYKTIDYSVDLRSYVNRIVNRVPLPVALASLADRVIDVQDADFTLASGAKRVEDSTASDGWASRMDPAAVNWSTQVNNGQSPLGARGKWHVYASVRCEKVRDAGPAFQCGVHPGATLAVHIEHQGKPLVTPGETVGDGKYHLYDLGVHELLNNPVVWFGTTGGVSPENVKAIYIDRVLFVREGTAAEPMAVVGESLVLAKTEPGNLCFDHVVHGSVTVRSAYVPGKPGTVVYIEGRDYVVDYAKGAIARTADSRIPDYSTHCLFGQKDFDHGKFPNCSNHEWFVWADYRTTNGQLWAKPSDQSRYLTATREKLEAGGLFRIVSYGDSITAGGEASEVALRFQQKYAKYLQAKFPKSKIEVQDVSISGYTSSQGVDWFDKKPVQPPTTMGTVEKPDLVVVGFGMNDHNISGLGVELDKFKANLVTLVKMIRERHGADVILFSAFPPNENWHYGSHQMDKYAAAAKQAAAEANCAYVDVYGTWEMVLKRKDQSSLLGNNINHPNDFGHWLYEQAFEAMTF